MAIAKEWWKTDAAGRRIGWMYPEEFEALVGAHYDERGWARRFAEDFDLSQPTVYRYRDGTLPIPKMIAALVLAMVQLGERGIARHLPDAEWLPERASLAYVGRQARAPGKERPADDAAA